MCGKTYFWSAEGQVLLVVGSFETKSQPARRWWCWIGSPMQGTRSRLQPVWGDSRFQFVEGDIADRTLVSELLQNSQPRAVVNFAAESHVDRSIEGPASFVQTNVVGTSVLLQACLDHWNQLEPATKRLFRFLQISTDEVFGSLGNEGQFTETSPYQPNSPYAASKAAADHLTRSFGHTFGLPVLVSHCTNNFGPYQFPEKLIPRMILNALNGETLPVYGAGENVRDWIFVGDHCEALKLILADGRPGEAYAIGANQECKNIDLVREIVDLLVQFSKDLPMHPVD